MSEGSVQKVLKEFALFFIAAIISSVIYFALNHVVSNKIYPILTASIIVTVLFILLIYRFFKKREKLLGIIDVFEKFEHAPPTLEIVNNAQISVEFMGISARTFFESEDVEELMKKKIREGVIFKFLILDSSSQYVDIKARDEGDDHEAWKYDINASIHRLERVKKETESEKIEAKKYDALPIWRGIFVDHKIAYATYYPHGHRGKHSPVFMIENREATLYIPLYSLYTYIWENSKEAI
jgi:hypothetical protein